MAYNPTLNQEKIDQICKSVSEGLPFRHAFHINGILETTGYDYREKGKRDPDSIYGLLKLSMDQAKSEYIRSLVNTVKTAAEYKPENWQAAARLLEARSPQDFSRSTKGDSDFRIDPNKTAVQQMHDIFEAVRKNEIPTDEALKQSALVQASIEVKQIEEQEDIMFDIQEKLNDAT